MLLIHPQVEKLLNSAREYMDELDQAATQFSIHTTFRAELENKLNYLRTYCCGDGEGGIDEFKSICFLYPDFGQYSFQFEVRARPELSQISLDAKSGLQGLQRAYSKIIINGGLIWQGPKSLSVFDGQSSKNSWGTHT